MFTAQGKRKSESGFLFPWAALEKAIQEISRTQWSVPLVQMERHGTNCVTCHFQDRRLHYSQRTDEKLVTAKIYTKLLQIVATSANGTAMLGTADISGNYYIESDGNGHSNSYSLDTDAFFLWFPSYS